MNSILSFAEEEIRMEKSILVVEDDAIVALHLRNILLGLGYRLIGPLATGEAAVAAVAESRPVLILMDIQLAGRMDGIAAARNILSFADLPIVFLTSFSQAALIQEAKSIAPYGYLLKPVSERELAVTIEIALNRHMLDRQLREHQDALRKGKDELELRVRARTAELVAANEMLQREVEERRRVEHALRVSEERYRRITEGLTDYFYTVRLNNNGEHIETVHGPGCEPVTGYSLAEYAADDSLWMRMVVEEDRERLREYTRRVLQKDDVTPIEHRITHKNGQIRWVNNTIVPQYDARGNMIAYDGVIKDITEKRLSDRRFLQREKLASLGLLIAGIAHEINNPNSFIYFNIPILRSYLQFFLPIADDYVAAHPEAKAFGRPYADFRKDCFKLMDNIEHGSTRINQIVGNLREFVRERGRGEKSRVNLKTTIEKAVSLCAGRIRRSIKTFEVHIPEGLPELVTDPLAIEQVVVNLLVNAVQAADKDDSWIRLSLVGPALPGDAVIIEVSDNGCGMDEETQRKIFDPFFTTKADVGTGLGLSISHRLVTELGGSIEVRSAAGSGSTLRVALPQ